MELPAIGDLLDKLDNAERDIQKRIGDLTDEINDLDDYTETIEERLEADDVPDAEQRELEEEQRAIAESKKQLRDDRTKSQAALQRMRSEASKIPAFSDRPAQ